MERTRAWWLTRIEFGIAVSAILLLVLYFVGRPGSMGPADPFSEFWLPLTGFLGLLFGLAWMWRIYRSGPEDSPSPWRYRDHG